MRQTIQQLRSGMVRNIITRLRHMQIPVSTGRFFYQPPLKINHIPPLIDRNQQATYQFITHHLDKFPGPVPPAAHSSKALWKADDQTQNDKNSTELDLDMLLQMLTEEEQRPRNELLDRLQRLAEDSFFWGYLEYMQTREVISNLSKQQKKKARLILKKIRREVVENLERGFMEGFTEKAAKNLINEIDGKDIKEDL